MTTTTNRTGYFVIFSYLGVGDPNSRETTVYLEDGQSFNEIAEIIAQGRGLLTLNGLGNASRVLLFSVDCLDGLTRERADEMRSVGKAWDAARASND
jgi:hypothetical protein